MRFFSPAVCTVVVVALLAGCNGTSSLLAPSGASTAAQTQSRDAHRVTPPRWVYPANLFDNKRGAEIEPAQPRHLRESILWR
jgi:hypothetical protein